jgi:hypothetical protein
MVVRAIIFILRVYILGYKAIPPPSLVTIGPLCVDKNVLKKETAHPFDLWLKIPLAEINYPPLGWGGIPTPLGLPVPSNTDASIILHMDRCANAFIL